MNAHSPRRPRSGTHLARGRMGRRRPPRYRALAAFATRDEAVAEAALHPGAMILFRPAPKPAPPPPLPPSPPPGPAASF